MKTLSVMSALPLAVLFGCGWNDAHKGNVIVQDVLAQSSSVVSHVVNPHGDFLEQVSVRKASAGDTLASAEMIFTKNCPHIDTYSPPNAFTEWWDKQILPDFVSRMGSIVNVNSPNGANTSSYAQRYIVYDLSQHGCNTVVSFVCGIRDKSTYVDEMFCDFSVSADCSISKK